MDRVLIANRGEIAVRIARTLRRLEIESVGVYAAADAGAPHTLVVDRALPLPDAGERSPYLNLEVMIATAMEAGADAVHPGYGFLAENAFAARALEQAGLVWIGPSPEAISLLGDKSAAKAAAIEAGVPVVPGLSEAATGQPDDGDGARLTVQAVAEFGAEHGFPLMIKAGAGGGGKGMRRVEEESQIEPALAAARGEAQAAFGSDHLLLEKLVEPARHIEVQVAVDDEGVGLALGERECSLQRRHQKLVEESPSPVVESALRERMQRAAVDLALAAGYRNLGTVEFLADAEDPTNFYFLEMNARLQVEHPVTELVTGLDLVEMQVAIARGESLARFGSGAVPPSGHAIEARICAERPDQGFLPATGRVVSYSEPAAARTDSGIAEGSEVGTGFDSMLLKLIVHGEDRAAAIEALRRALADLVLLGVETNTDFLLSLSGTEQFRRGQIDVGFTERWVAQGSYTAPGDGPARSRFEQAAATIEAVAAASEAVVRGGSGFSVRDGWRLAGAGWGHWQYASGSGEPIELVSRAVPGGAELRSGLEAAAIRVTADALTVERRGPRDGDGGTVELFTPPQTWTFARDHGDLWLHGPAGTAVLRAPAPPGSQEAAGGGLVAELPGTVLAVKAAAGETVAAGQPLLTVESMKMELEITAPESGVLAELAVAEGDHVARGQILAVVEAVDAPPDQTLEQAGQVPA